jgi:hypothetical protein
MGSWHPTPGCGHKWWRKGRPRTRRRPPRLQPPPSAKSSLSRPGEPHRLGAAARARLGHRYAALPELPLGGVRDRRGHPGATGHREDLDPPGAGSAAAAQGPRARGGAKLRHLSCAGRHKRLDPGCAASGSRGDAAPHAGSMPTHPGATQGTRSNEPQANRQRPAESRQDNGATASSKPSRPAPAAHPCVSRAFSGFAEARGRLKFLCA